MFCKYVLNCELCDASSAELASQCTVKYDTFARKECINTDDDNDCAVEKIKLILWNCIRFVNERMCVRIQNGDYLANYFSSFNSLLVEFEWHTIAHSIM